MGPKWTFCDLPVGALSWVLESSEKYGVDRDWKYYLFIYVTLVRFLNMNEQKKNENYRANSIMFAFPFEPIKYLCSFVVI